MNFFLSLSITTRIGALSGLSMIAIAILGTTFFLSSQAIDRENQNLALYSNMDWRQSQVKAHALEMRQLAREFSLSNDPALLEPYVKAFESAETQFGELSNAAYSASIADNLDRLKAGVTDHRAKFDLLTSDYQAMGLTENDGLRGELRAAVHAVEEKLNEANLDALTVKMLMMRRHEKDFMLRGGEKYIERIDARRSEFDPLLAETALSDADKAEIMTSMDRYQAGFKAYAVMAKEIEEDIAALDQTYAAMVPDFDALSEAAYQGKVAAQKALEATQASAQTVFYSAAGGALAIAIVLAFLIGRSITRPVQALTGTMKNLAEGNIDVSVPFAETGSEIGDMARAVEVFQRNALRTRELEEEQKQQAEQAELDKRAMMDNLADQFDSAIGGIVARVSNAVTNLSETARTMSSVSEDTSGRAEAASSASQTTSENVQMVASAAEEMTASINEINQQVIRASTSSQKAASDVEVTARQMNNLAAMVDKIGEVVSMISEIAEQTNLLALNATIESARVGEAGKGFAVVAGEVKALANETAKATESISDLISKIQAETKTAVGSIDQIGQVIRDLENTSGAIAAAMEEQGVTTQSVARNVSDAATGTRDVSDSIAVVRSASEEARAASAQVMASAEDLAQQSGLMKNEVERFLAQIRAA
ncbi:methyl-accepting chemotaxis protein [Roseibium aquae]|nr:HAMP domain-containing methyl-accepting chemotaxis protein [Roseibium aquae]